MNFRDFMVLLVFWMCSSSWGGAGVSAKSAPMREGPPVLPPVEVKVEGRLPVRVVLKASGIRLSPVKFVVRKDPAFGRLRLLKQVAGDSVEVEYVPPVDLSIREDFFWFAAANAAGFSSDTRAHIQIMDVGPRLQVALALDFPATKVGLSSRLPLEVLNSGDQPAKGRITVDVPWEIEAGGDEYALEPGERKTVGVLFKPAKAGWAQAQIQLSGNAFAAVQLRAEALDWVEVARDPVPLVWAEDRQQIGELRLSNSGSEPLLLTLEASPRLEHQTKILIDPGTMRAVPLKWSGAPVPGGWGTLVLASEAGMRRVVVWNLDAMLSGLGSPFVLEKSGAVNSARRTFKNDGGRPGTWTFRCDRPFSLGDAEHVPKSVSAALPESGSPVRASGKKSEDHAAAPGPGLGPNLRRDVPSRGAPGASTLPGAGLPSQEAAKKNEEHAAIPGFVWDHNQNRYVPSRGVPKPSPEPHSVTRGVPPPAEQKVQLLGGTVLTRTLQPGESFEFFVGLSGTPMGSTGTLFVEGPGGAQREGILVREAVEGGRSQARLIQSVPAPVTTPAVMRPEPSLGGVDLPPVLAPSTPAAVAPVGAVMPALSPSKKPAGKRESPPIPNDLKSALFAGVVYRGVRVKDLTHSAATLVFPVGPGVEPNSLVVRYREILPAEGGNIVTKWHAFDAANRRGKRVGDQIEIRLRGLSPGAVNCIDLLGPVVNGGRDKVFEKEITTPPSPGLTSPTRIWLWLAIAAVVGGSVVLKYRLKHQGSF